MTYEFVIEIKTGDQDSQYYGAADKGEALRFLSSNYKLENDPDDTHWTILYYENRPAKFRILPYSDTMNNWKITPCVRVSGGIIQPSIPEVG